jgi:prevent-host-death family protein
VDTVGSHQAKTNLPRLLKRASRGERITITRHGTPVALLTPPTTPAESKPAKKRRTAVPNGDFGAELRWLEQHRKQYAGQWVAVDGARLLAHSRDARKVHEAARRLRGRLPLVAYVEPHQQAFWGGW